MNRLKKFDCVYDMPIDINANSLAYQFHISLRETTPSIWRRILVPSVYSFWDLHVAIQDSMGWFDCHMHEFIVKKKRARKPLSIGIPDPDGLYSPEMIPGWEISIASVLSGLGHIFEYTYDYGDDWVHDVLFEGILIKDKKQKYPQCQSGELACPPEDCGGVSGYYNMLEAIENPEHEEHQDFKRWLPKGYDPTRFDPGRVKFDNPQKRWNLAFRD